MKIAITHDYLIDFGGAERVLLALHEIYPEAPIYVSILNKKGLGEHWKEFEKINIKTSWFNHLPFASKLISPLRFLLPLIWRSFGLSGYDLIIDSSSWAITRGFKTRKNQTEICYCHTPPRYLYGYDTSRKWKNRWYRGLVSFYSLVVNHFMRMYDFQQAQKVDYFIANSKNIAQRIKKFYRRESALIYPPASHPTGGSASHFSGKARNYFLTGGRLVAAKNFDLIIKACNQSGANLKIFGFGPLLSELKKVGGEKVEFLGDINDSELVELYRGAMAFIVAQKDEDFGITTIEAMSHATPVIAYRGGGYLETVIDGKTGVFFDEPTTDSLISAIKKFEKIKFKDRDLVTQAKKFSKDRFKREIKEFVENVWQHK